MRGHGDRGTGKQALQALHVTRFGPNLRAKGSRRDTGHSGYWALALLGIRADCPLADDGPSPSIRPSAQRAQ